MSRCHGVAQVYLRVLDSFESGSLELRKAWPVVKDDTSAAAMGRALQSAAAQAPGGSEVCERERERER